MREFIDRAEKECGTLIWRHFCKLIHARNEKDFWDALKAIASIIDKLL